MAKLIDRMALGQVRQSAATPDVNAGTPDYGIMEAGNRSLARGVAALSDGVAGLAKGMGAAAAYESEQEGYEVKKKLIDWKLQTEMDLEAKKREMPVGGAGFSDTWRSSFRDSATGFVGEKDANIPAHLRGKVGVEIKRHEASLSERAQRMEWAERDKSNIEGLQETSKALLSKVEAAPDSKDDVHQEGEKLILAAPIPPADRHRLAKGFKKEVDKTAAVSRLMAVRSREDYDALERDLAPNMPDKPVPLSAVSPAGTLDFIKKQEGERDQGWDYRQYSGPYGVKRGPNEKLTKEQAEERLKQEVGEVERALDAKIKVPLSPNQRTALASLFYNIGTGKGRVDQVANLINSGQSDRVPGWIQQFNRNADGGFMQGLASRRSREAALFARGGGDDTPAVTPKAETANFDTGGMPGPSSAASYSGTYSNLSLVERKALVGQAKEQWNKQVSELKGAIDKYAGVAAEGVPPPQHILDEIDSRVKAAKDPTVSAHYGVMLGKLTITQQMGKAPPQGAREFADSMMEDAVAAGATPERMAIVKHAEKVAESIEKHVTENPVGWASRNKIEVPLADGPPPDHPAGQPWKMPTAPAQAKRIDFGADDIDGQLDERFSLAKGVARYYGKPFVGFTPAERTGLQNALKNGGEPMLIMFGRIANAAQRNGVDPALVMQEFTRDAPELAHIGSLVAEGGDRTILETAAKAMAWKIQMKDKFESTIQKSAAQPDLAEYAEVLSSTPEKVDALKHTAGLVYEYEARLQGKTSFDSTLYRSVVARLMGQTKDRNGVEFGGVGTHKTGWVSRASVRVPPDVRSDSFTDMLGGLRANDLEKTGLPMHASGEPWTMGEIRGATWVSTGPGKYWLQKSRSDDGKRELAVDKNGRPFVFDINPVLGNIKARKPEVFKGYDALTAATPAVVPDPDLPDSWTAKNPPKKKPEPAAEPYPLEPASP